MVQRIQCIMQYILLTSLRIQFLVHVFLDCLQVFAILQAIHIILRILVTSENEFSASKKLIIKLINKEKLKVYISLYVISSLFAVW